MSLVEYAESELAIAGIAGDDGYGGMLYQSVIDLVKLFADQGHSGSSAGQAISMLERLMRFEPLTPLTGDDTEWNDVSDVGGRDGGPLWQNRRCSHIFKEEGGAYDISAVVVRDPSGGTWSPSIRTPVTFPHTHTEPTVILIDRHGYAIEDPALGIVPGFCDDDGCRCWHGGERLELR